MKHYAFENGQAVDMNQLKVGRMTRASYGEASEHLVVACHDVYIRYKGGILLTKRRIPPAIDLFWPLGGRMEKGLSNEDSLRKHAMRECGLRLADIKELDTVRVSLAADAFGHGKGTDALAIVYFAESEGELILDEDHADPVIITKSDYTEEFRNGLDPYVRDFMDMAMQL